MTAINRPASALATTMAALCSLWLATSPATAGPAQGRDGFDQVPNFREVTGSGTASGPTLRAHVLYRAGVLSGMSAADERKLKALGVRSEIDLRGPIERGKQPSAWRSRAPAVFTPFSEVRVGPNDSYPKVYRDIAIHHAREIGDALKVMETAPGPILIHCTAGNDRTGLEIAIFMKILGFPRADIHAEYLRSNAYWKATGDEPLRPEFLDRTFEAIDARYGSFDSYVAKGLRLTKDDVRRLKTRFLSPAGGRVP